MRFTEVADAPGRLVSPGRVGGCSRLLPSVLFVEVRVRILATSGSSWIEGMFVDSCVMVRLNSVMWSYRRRGTEKAMFAPEEKPLRAILLGLMPRLAAFLVMYKTASTPSSTAVGNGHSGARRYSTDTTTASHCSTTVPHHRASSVGSPKVKPPPWKLMMHGYPLCLAFCPALGSSSFIRSS